MTSAHPHAHAKPAFSLIELLVVITIIAVLIGITLPALRKARDAADNVKCGSGLRQIGLSMVGYAGDFGQRWINYSDGTVRWPSTLISANRLPKGKTTIFECPADTAKTTDPNVLKWELGGGYGFNNDLNGYGKGPSSSGQPIGKRIDQVALPAQYACLWDSTQPLVASSTSGWVFDRSTYTSRLPDPTRHNGTGNILFMDCRVAPFLPLAITQPLVTYTHQ